jgi:2,4-dienoyl-CoA reductase-like NADH-dependent reductase (Old Yellow Enzyme family)
MTEIRRTFTPTTIGPVRLRNRTIRSAAFEGMSPGGEPGPALVDYHGSVAAGGVGMTTVAYAAVTRDGLTFDHQLHMRPEIVAGLRRLTDAIHREGAAASIQLGHAGYMGDARVGGRRPLAPSRVFNLYGLTMPEAMSGPQIDELVQAFGRAVALCREAGFDAVEVQAGHGYLVSQFLSPYTNRRTDAYGGGLEGRARFLRLVMREVRRVAGQDLGVVVKTNLSDGFAGGMTHAEGIAVARILEEEGADALVLSGGFVSKCPFYMMRGDVPVGEILKRQPSVVNKVGLALFGRVLVQTYPFREAFFLEEALAVRAAVRLPLVLVGGLRSLATMEEVLGRGFDAVAMARPLIIDPGFVRRLERGEIDRSHCVPCNECVATMYTGAAVCLPLVEGREPRTRA